MKSICIGLFGTCGNSTWRNDFIQRYLHRGMKDGVDFFNPQIKDWKPEFAQIEATHLSEDQILCFPVTKETYGIGSLAETGFSIMQGLKFDDRREILLLIDLIPDPSLDIDDPDKGLSRVAYKESTRARALIRCHIKKITWNNVRLLDTIEEMLEWSIYLRDLKTDLNNFKPYLGK